MSVELDLDGLELDVRLNILSRVINEFAEKFRFPSEVHEAIQKGILENQIIRKIKGYYFDSEEKVIGNIIFDIDWDKHNVFAADDNLNIFKFESDKPLIYQISDCSKIIERHVCKMIEHYNVSKVKLQFEYIEEISKDKDKYQQSLQLLGHVLGKSISVNKEMSQEFNSIISFTSQNLQELTIEIHNNKFGV